MQISIKPSSSRLSRLNAVQEPSSWQRETHDYAAASTYRSANAEQMQNLDHTKAPKSCHDDITLTNYISCHHVVASNSRHLISKPGTKRVSWQLHYIAKRPHGNMGKVVEQKRNQERHGGETTLHASLERGTALVAACGQVHAHAQLRSHFRCNWGVTQWRQKARGTRNVHLHSHASPQMACHIKLGSGEMCEHMNSFS